MLIYFLWPNLDHFDFKDMCFHEDGVACHTANATIDILQEQFNEMTTSRNATVSSSPRSCNFTSLDYLKGYLKCMGYRNKQH